MRRCRHVGDGYFAAVAGAFALGLLLALICSFKLAVIVAAILLIILACGTIR